jgi:hypothetical protein
MLSSYEHGHRFPALATASRILAGAGFELTATSIITATVRPTAHGRDVLVPSRLPRLDPSRALARVTLSLHLNWSDPHRSFDLRDRRQRARVCEIVLREGDLADLLRYVDGVLLVDLWDELVLPRAVREAWTPLITQAIDLAV